MGQVFLGNPPADIVQQMEQQIELKKITHIKVHLSSSYNKAGIYSATREDASKPIEIDWGDGTVEQINSDVSEKTHTYSVSSDVEYEITIKNANSIAASSGGSLKNPDSTFVRTSQNRYTITAVTFGSSVTVVNQNAFYECEQLENVTLSDRMTSIESGAFNYCSKIKYIVIPDSLTNFGFIPNTIESFLVRPYNPVYSSSANGLLLSSDRKTLIKGINVPTVEIPNTVININSSAFTSHSKMVNVIMPNSTTSIGNYAFDACSSLQNVVISNVINIGEYAFRDCTSLTSMTIPTGIQSINSAAFLNCSNFASISIGSSISSIGGSAFSHCSNLMAATIMKTMSSVQSMENYPWDLPSGCTITCTDGEIIV